jgi:acyl-coenzyme A thioesterase PaaI-like protein
MRTIDDEEIARRASEHGLSSRVALADRMRALLENMACSQADDERVLKAAALLREADALIEGEPRRPAHVRYVEGSLTGFGELNELGPFTGRLHPIAPPFRLVLDGERAEAFATYGNAYQGAPGLLQGGFIAATFDELLAVVQTGAIRMTVDLQLSYRAPTPLHRELRYTTWLDRIDGRKAHVLGTLHDGDRLCAEARAIFVEPRERPF